MKKSVILGAAVSATALGGLGGQAIAQDVDNYFVRDRNIAVLERAKDDYTPLGIDLGGFMLQPYSGLDVGENDNVKYTNANKASSGYVSLTPGFEALSNWDRNMLKFGLDSNITDYSGVSSENFVSSHTYADGRYDISSRMNITADLHYNEGVESRASALADPSAIKPVKDSELGGSLGYTVVWNRLRFIGSLSSVADKFENVASVDGGVINESYRNATFNDEVGQLDYALSPAVAVYGLIDVNQRRYSAIQSHIDNSDGVTYSIGSNFDLTSLLRGDVQVGTFSQSYKNVAGGQLNNLYYKATVQWFPTQLMTVSFAAGRSYVESGAVSLGTHENFGSIGALQTSYSVGVDHELLRNLILSASLITENYKFSGINRNDASASVYLGGQYYLSRRLSVRAGYTYTNLSSTGSAAFRSYTDNQVQVGLVLRY